MGLSSVASRWRPGWVALLDDDGAKPQGARHWEGGTARFDTQDALGGDDMTCEDGVPLLR